MPNPTPVQVPLRVPFNDLGASFADVEQDVRSRFDAVLASQNFVAGAQTEELEARLSALTGAHAVACSSGSDAIYLALLAAGIGPGDAVIVPAFTFFSTAGSVVRAGATPVFADIDPITLMTGARELRAVLDEEFAAAGADGSRVGRRTGARLAAVIAVHLYGRAAPVHEFEVLLKEYGSPMLLEDAAQAIGARTASGTRRIGDGQAVCFSFYPTKNVGGAGDGGAVTTRDEQLALRLRSLRNHGAGSVAYRHEQCGINARIAELSAAMVNAKLERIDAWTEARGRIARRYEEGLAGLELSGSVRRPLYCAPPASVWHQYTIRFATGRDAAVKALAVRGVETRVFYPLALHRQPCFSEFAFVAGCSGASEQAGKRGDAGAPGSGSPEHPRLEAERAADDVLSLPIHPALTADQVEQVIEALTAVCTAAAEDVAAAGGQ